MAGPFKIVAGNLPFDISEEELHTVFSTYGEVLRVEILSEDPATGARQANITYREQKSAEDAITVLHEIYKIRTDAERPIQVWSAKEDMPMSYQDDSGAAPGGGVGPCDWSGGKDSGGWGGGAGYGGGCGGGQQSKPPPPEDSYKLFVGGLPDDITEEELNTVFGTYGEVVHVHIMKPNSMTGLRAAFVYYSKREAGEDAIKVLNDSYKIRVDAEAPIQVRWGKEGKGDGKGLAEDMPNKLFVGSLPAEITEEEVRTVFTTYGEINHIHLMAPHSKTGMRAALVFYVRRESGEDAIKVLHEQYKFREDSENPIQVKWGKDRDPPYGGKGSSKGGWGGGWGESSGGGWGGKGGGGGWQALGNGDSWGDRSRAWDQTSWWQDNRWSDGWRDLGWGGKGWGGDAWGGGKGKGDKGGYGKGDKGGCGKGYDKGYDRGGYGKGGYDKGGYDRGYDKGGYDKGGDKGKGKGEDIGKLYVANLPEDIQENALEYVFGTYGKVLKVHIMAQNNRNGAISAFVEFGTAEEAETAIASLNDKYEIRAGYGPIHVKHANARRPRPY